MDIITVKNLTKSYTTYKRGSGLKETMKSFFRRETVKTDAVSDVTFSIAQGEICGILGPNGAGKSTMIKMLCGALFPTTGSIDVMGFSPAKDRKKYVQQIGVVFGQKSQLIWDIPPIDSFAMNKAIYQVSDADYRQRLEELSSLFGVEEVMHKPTRVLSLGERMKCEFIMAMLHNPEIIFLDEPTIGLDVIAKATIRNFIREMNGKGKTFILTTHDLEDVEQLAHRVVIINHGKKVFDDVLPKLRLALGEKKIVELVLTKPVDVSQIDFAKVISHKSDYDISLEADMETMGIHDFLQKISTIVEYKDIAIRELPMEQIITKIYGKEPEK